MISIISEMVCGYIINTAGWGSNSTQARYQAIVEQPDLFWLPRTVTYGCVPDC